MLSKLITLKFWGLFIMASVKFAVGVPAALLFYHFNFLQGFAFSVASGLFGIYFWLYISKFMFKAIDFIKDKYQGKINKKKKRIFTPYKRKLVRLKTRYGLIGISIITPTIISIPVGTIVAARIYKHDRRHVFIYLAVSVIAWSAMFSALFTFFKPILGAY